MGSKSKSTTNQTQTSYIDPQTSTAQWQNYGDSQAVANLLKGSAYTGPLSADFSNTTLPTAINTTDALANYNAPKITPTMISGDPISAATYQAHGYTPTTIAQNGVNQYMSPYLGSVVGTGLNDLLMTNARQLSQNDGNGIAAGAWGGDRAGVADALTNEATGRTAASMVSNLLNSGFSQALGASGQDVNTLNQGGQFNADALNTAGQFNAGAQNTIGLANQANNFNAQQANQSAGLTAGQANQNADLASAGLRGNAASMLTGIAGAQQAQQQAALTAQYDEWLRQLAANVTGQTVQDQGLGMITPTTTQTLNGTTTQSTNPGFMGVLGGLGGLAMGLGTMGMGGGGLGNLFGGMGNLFGGTTNYFNPQRATI